MIELLLTFILLQTFPENPQVETQTFYVGSNLYFDPYPQTATGDMLVAFARVLTPSDPNPEWQVAGATIPPHQRPSVNAGIEVQAIQSEVITVEFMARVIALGVINSTTQESGMTTCDSCSWTIDSNTVTIEFQVCEFATRPELLDCMNVTDPSP